MRLNRVMSLLVMVIMSIALLAGQALAASFHGTWKTNMGRMVIHQNGSSVQGTYGSSGKLSGRVSGDTLSGRYSWNGKNGTFKLALIKGGSQFTGRWSRPGAKGSWTGARVGSAPVAKPAATGKRTVAVTPQPPSNARAGVTPLSRVDFNGSRWLVEDARNGKNRDYHHMPWVFRSNGYVEAKGFWRGLWERSGKDRIKIILILVNGTAITDVFELQFINGGRELIAFKNGQPYRYGMKTN